MNVLSITNLEKSFKDKLVLKGLNLEIKEKSIFGFIGKNGSGKTTTMKLILGLLKPNNGEIYILNEKVTFGDNKTNKYIGYLPDVPNFYPFMNAYEYLTLCGEALEIDKTTLRNKISELLELVGLKDEKSLIKGYSRGMKQRLGIAQALLGDPKLLICDEPTSALDPIGRKEILDILSKVKEKTTVLFSTHILSDVERICTDIAFINDGKIILSGSVNQIKNMNQNNNYLLELINIEDEFSLINKFNITKNDIGYIIPNKILNDVLIYILENNIKFKKLEKIETTLESLFMEVTK